MFLVTLQTETVKYTFMAEVKQMKTALISVFHKDGLDDLLAKLHSGGVKFFQQVEPGSLLSH